VKNVMVLSGTASAINYIKSLAGDPDIRLHITDANPYCPGLYAPGVIPHLLPRARDTARYRVALDRLLKEHSIDVLIPTSDYDAEGVVHYLQDGWTPKPAMFRPPFEAFHVLGHKGRLMAHLAEHLPSVVPHTWAGSDDLRDLNLPVVVKPTGESGGKGVTIVRHRDDLAAAVGRIRALYGDEFLVQQFIPGQTYIVSMVYDHDGRLVITIPMRSHLTFFTWGGGGCAGEVVDEPELSRLCAGVAAVSGGWRGPINFEWRRHAETGAFYLMEANCRLNGYSYLTTMNGVCLPRIVLALLTGEPLPTVAPPTQRNRNFILGFREKLVDRWVQPAQVSARRSA
jgi:predicted ATP-grasp superfamily ATP-dependent carboligase